MVTQLLCPFPFQTKYLWPKFFRGDLGMTDMVESYVFGIYPRSEKLIEITRRRRYGAPDFAKESGALFDAQRRAGLAYVQDPLLSWDDMFRPLTLSSRGIKPDGINRFFETNTFYRVPVLEGEIDAEEDVTTRSLHLGLYRPEDRRMASLPDPLTFAALSKDEHYGETSRAIAAMGELLSKQAGGLRKAGFELLVLKGPAYGFMDIRKHFDRIAEAISLIKRAFVKRVILHTYFKPVKEAELLKELPVDGLGFDLISGGQGLRRMDDKELSLGLVDGYSTLLEEGLAVRAMGLLDSINPPRAYITNNVDFEYIPYKFAIKKLDVLRRTVRRMNND